MANLLITISGKLDKSLDAAVKSAEKSLNGLGNGGRGSSAIASATNAAASAVAVTTKASLAGLTSIAAASTAALKASVSEGMEFETHMSDLASTAGIDRASEAYQNFSDIALSVGGSTNKSASECSDAMKFMSLAGWDLNEMYKTLGQDGTSELESATEKLVKLSSSTRAELGDTSDLVTDSMSALGLQVSDMSNYLDIAAKMNNSANTSALGYMETMIGAGGASRMLGMSLNDLSISTGILANNGTKGAAAGTALNSMLGRLAGNSTAQKAMKELGIELYDTNGKFIGMQNVLNDVNTALDSFGSDTQGRNTAMRNLFGQNYLSEAEYLLDSVRMAEDGVSAWSELAGELENTTGALDNMYRRSTDNLAGDMDIFKSAVSTFGIEIYEAISGDNSMLRLAVQGATDYTNQLRTAFAQDGALGLAAAIGDIAGELSRGVSASDGEFIKIGMGFATKLVEGFKNNGEDIGGAVAVVVTSFLSEFPGFTSEFAIAGLTILDGILEGMTSAGADGTLPAEKIVGAITGAFSDIGNYLVENGDSMGEAAGLLMVQLATAMADHADEMLIGGIHIISGLAKGIFTALPILVQAVPSIVKSLISGLADSAGELYDAGKNLVMTIVDGVVDSGYALGDAMLEVADDLGMINHYGEDYGQAYGEAYVSSLSSYISSHQAEVTAAAQELLGGQVDEGLFHSWGETVEMYIDMFSKGNIETSFLEGLAPDVIEAQRALEIISSAMQEVAAQSPEMQAAADGISSQADAAAETAAQMEGAAEQTNRFTEQMETACSTSEEAAVTAETVQAELDAMAESATNTSESVEGAMEALANTDALANLVEAASAGEDLSAIGTAVTETMTVIQTAVSSSFELMAGDVETYSGQISATVTTCMIEVYTDVSAGCLQIIADSESCAAGVIAAFSSINLAPIGANIMLTFASSITSYGQSAIAAAQNIANQVAATMAAALQIGSPSKVMDDLGMWSMAGYERGFVRESTGVMGAIEDVASGVPSAFAEGMKTEEAVSSASFGGGSWEGQEGTGAGSGEINWSPQIIIQGNASREDVEQALTMSMDEFRRMYEAMKRYDARSAYA